MLTIESEEQLLAIVDESMMQERLGEMWYNADVSMALEEAAPRDVVEELKRIREEEREHFETFRDIAIRLPGGGVPPEEDIDEETEGAFEELDRRTNLTEALAEKRDAEDQGEDLYRETARALRRCDLDLDTDGLADTFDRIAAEEADHRDTLDRVLNSLQ